ncbi:MAG TPA: PaaI family thioesterase [Steroidobacteraceae bacterium]|nr:PaaI family thioesterase [Steroidobacteraceae bacterium]
MANLDAAELQQVFDRAPFIRDLGVTLESIAVGECVTALIVQPRFLQQNGFVHAGVQASLADHSMGAVAYSVAQAGQRVLTVEFKMSLLRAAQGEKLICRAKVLKPGKQFTFTEAEVFCVASGAEQLTMKASATMAVVSAEK